MTINTYAAAALVALIGAGAAHAQDAKPAAPDLTPLAMEAGTWDADITFPSRKAGVPDTKAKGVQVNTLRSDGKWMLNEFKVEGTPYEGTGLWGWDSASASYRGIWGDNNEHRIRQDVGTWDAAAKTMTWTSTLVESTGKTYPLRFVEAFAGDVRTFDMVAILPTGQEAPLVRMTFTRRKA